MRWTALLVLAGCNRILGISDPPPPDGDPCVETCECREDTDCAAHAYCNDQTTLRSCECAAGFTEQTDGSCLFTGLVADPGFQSPAVWIGRDGATVAPTYTDTNMVDPGAVVFAKDMCAATVKQALVMPRYSLAGPLVAVISHSRRGPGGGNRSSGVAFGVSDHWNESLANDVNSTFGVERACLGAGQYAPESSTGAGVETTVEASLTAHAQHEDQCRDDSYIDRFEIVPAETGECPPPGPIANGDAETDDGWVFGTGSYGAVTSYTAGVGENGSRGIRMVVPQVCAFSDAKTKLSTPVAPSSLVYYVKVTGASTAGGVQLESYDGISLDFLGANAQISRTCLPPYVLGNPDTLRIYGQDTTTGTTCGTPHATNEVVADSVVLAADPRCGTDPRLVDAGFESGFSRIGDSAYAGTGAAIVLLDQAAAAHEGSHAADMRLTGCSGSASFLKYVIAPPADATGGPALKYWYRTTGTAISAMYAQTDRRTNTLVRDTQWRTDLLCLDPKRPHRMQTIAIGVYPGPTCAGSFDEHLIVDDLSLVTDPSCPAQ